MAEHLTVTRLTKRYRYPIYPTPAQAEQINKTLGCCRYVYNKLLADTKAEYEAHKAALAAKQWPLPPKPKVSGYDLVLRIPALKASPKSQWLVGISYVALQQAALRLGKAYTRFFAKRKEFPRFRKKGSHESCMLVGSAFKYTDGVLRIAKCASPVKLVMSRPMPSQPSSVTIIRDACGRYYASFVCDYVSPKTTGTGSVGLDLGIKTLIACSNGEMVANPRHTVKHAQQLRRAQQALARSQRGSKNRVKARQRVARIHAKIRHARENLHHQLSRRLVNDHAVISIEDLKVTNMAQNRKLSKHIYDAGWAMLRRFLEYKVRESQHVTLVVLNSFYPSSHICSCCGKRLNRKLALSERSWVCPHCQSEHDRDLNAAQAIDQACRSALEAQTSDLRGMMLLAKPALQ